MLLAFFPADLLTAGAVLAAGATPGFFAEVAVLLVASAVMAYCCHRLRITPIVSFLVTGALIGPQALRLVTDQALIEAVAEVGVVLLLFTIGIEFSLDKLGRIKRLIFVGGGLQVALVLAAVTGLLMALGVDWRAGVFTGCLVALSSTAIVMKLLMSRGETDTLGGATALGILIFQDLAVVAMVLVVPMLGGGGGSAGGLLAALGKAVAIILLVLVVARRVMPRVLEAVARTCSQEIFVLTVMAICFGTAFLTSLAGVSLSLGAFLAGLIVSESRFSELAFGEVQPLQILFSAAFFVSVGLLLDLSFLVSHLPLVLALVAGLIVLKTVAAAVAVKVLGYGLGTVAFASLLLAQVGEFSFVLERTGREVGLYPAGLVEGSQAFIAATVLSMMVTPVLAVLGRRLDSRWERRLDARERDAAALSPEAHAAEGATDFIHGGLEDHVVIAGYGRSGKALARALADHGVPLLILTLSPAGAREAEERGLPVLRGNYTRRHELTLANVDRARLLVVADDDLEMTHRVLRAVGGIAPELPVMAGTRLESEIDGLREIGAGRVVADEREGALRLVEEVLALYDVEDAAVRRSVEALRAAPSPHGPDPTAPAAPEDPTGDPTTTDPRQTVRLTSAQKSNPGCDHTPLTRAVVPDSDGCDACRKLGDSWVHLRVCMTCGQVGCCDSSKNRHASRHAHQAGHPIAKSMEPGESWAWCFRDEVML
jgi:monovalent cation:H+ antiporter-2, CPA2 family